MPSIGSGSRIPPGGSTGQLLLKNSAVDYDLAWFTASGLTPVFSIGTVSALAAGATPTVTQTGTTAAPVLNFGFPAAATGGGSYVSQAKWGTD